MAKNKSKGKHQAKSRRPAFVNKTKPKSSPSVDQSVLIRKIEEDLSRDDGFVSDIRKQEREVTTRRMIKLFCVGMHSKYKFGNSRLAELMDFMADDINYLLKYSDDDAGDFWYRIDQYLKKHNLEFYETEDEYNSKEIKTP